MCHYVFFLFLDLLVVTATLKLEEKINLTRFSLNHPYQCHVAFIGMYLHEFPSLSLEDHGSEHFTMTTSCLELKVEQKWPFLKNGKTAGTHSLTPSYHRGSSLTT